MAARPTRTRVRARRRPRPAPRVRRARDSIRCASRARGPRRAQAAQCRPPPRAGDRSCRRAPRRRRARACRARPRRIGAASCAAASCTETSPFANPGSAPTSTGSREPQRLRRERAGFRREPLGREPRAVGIARSVPAIDAQPHRRLGIAGRGDRLPVARPVALEGGEQPFRMRERRLARAVRGGEQRRRARAGTGAAAHS